MRRLVVADIFGRTSQFEKLYRSLGEQAEIVDPYSGTFLDFDDEFDAYNYFMNHVGIDQYGEVLRAKLKSVSTPTELIGFSVGASAVWRISDQLRPEFINRIVCFYGSQIRHYLDVSPCVNVELVLPEFEPGFSVDKLAQEMTEKANVTIHKTQYLHGFMNPHSKNFNHAGYGKYVEWLRTTAG